MGNKEYNLEEDDSLLRYFFDKYISESKNPKEGSRTLKQFKMLLDAREIY